MNGKIRSCTYGNVNDSDMELRVDITDPLNSIYDIFDRSVSILIQYFPNNKIAEGSDSGISSGREKSASRKNSGYMGSVSTIVDERGEKRTFSEESVVLEKSRKERIRPLKSG